MYRPIFPVILLLLAGLITGCAMDKKDCQNADWHAFGYNDGLRGRPASYLDVYSKRCGKFNVTPDSNAYQTGWGEGIRAYCTSANGFNTGAAGYVHSNVCPPDVAPAYMAGYHQGLEQYCSPENALRVGLAGATYRGVCPAGMANDFMNRYRLGQDVRRARIVHHNIESRLGQVRRSLSGEKNPERYHDLLQDLAHLRHQEEHSEAMQVALEACMGNDWYEAGLSDGEAGQPYRANDIASICRDYGSPADDIGYRQGWQDGNSHYCTYESGVYAGQGNQEYRGVCHGPAYLMFWGGYLKGLGLFRAGRYEEHPRPRHPRSERRERRSPPPAEQRRRPQPSRHQARPQHRGEPARIRLQPRQAQHRTQAPKAQAAPPRRQQPHATSRPEHAPAHTKARAAQPQQLQAKPGTATGKRAGKAKHQPVPNEKAKRKNGNRGEAAQTNPQTNDQTKESEQGHQRR